MTREVFRSRHGGEDYRVWGKASESLGIEMVVVSVGNENEPRLIVCLARGDRDQPMAHNDPSLHEYRIGDDAEPADIDIRACMTPKRDRVRGRLRVEDGVDAGSLVNRRSAPGGRDQDHQSQQSARQHVKTSTPETG
jgi:hypothetical protein